MRYLCFLLFITPLLAQITPENTPLQKLSTGLGYKHLSRRLGAANDVVYSITDPSRYQEFYHAVVQGHDAAAADRDPTPTGKILWSWLPDIKKKYKKNIELVAADPLFKNIIELNQALYKAAAMTDLQERRQALHRIYDQAPAYSPTLVMVIDTEWALGNFATGDLLLLDLNRWEPADAYWPLQILNARQTRRGRGIDEGLKMLKDSDSLNALRVNPIKSLAREWAEEIKNAAGPAALFEMGAAEALKEQIKTHPKAAYYLARLSLKNHNAIEAATYLRKVPKNAQTVDTFALGAQIEVAENGPDSKRPLGKKSLAQVRTYLESNPDHAKLHMLAAYDNKADEATRRASMLKAVQLDPKDDDIYTAAREMFTRTGDDEALRQVFQARVKALPEVNLELIYLRHLVKMGAQDEALTQIKVFLERYPDNHFFYPIANPLILNLKGLDNFKGHYAAKMLNLIDQLIQAGEVNDADTLAAQLVQLYPDRRELDVLQANIHLVRGRYEEALALYEKAMTLHPNHAALYELAGDAWISMDKPGKAADAYQKAAAMNPNMKERITTKLEIAEGRHKEKYSLFGAPTFQTEGFVTGPGGIYRLGWKPRRMGRPLSALSGGNIWSGSGMTGQAIHETSTILAPFYEFLLDLDTAWLDGQEED